MVRLRETRIMEKEKKTRTVRIIGEEVPVQECESLFCLIFTLL